MDRIHKLEQQGGNVSLDEVIETITKKLTETTELKFLVCDEHFGNRKLSRQKRAELRDVFVPAGWMVKFDDNYGIGKSGSEYWYARVRPLNTFEKWLYRHYILPAPKTA